MERLLWLYALPLDPEYPQVCFDERPCFLIGEELDPRPLQSGHPTKEHYAYTKNGACTLLAAIEPLTGKRLVQVKSQRTKKEYTRVLPGPGSGLSPSQENPPGAGQLKHPHRQCLLRTPTGKGSL